jgi:HK97 gp10 family phage protein
MSDDRMTIKLTGTEGVIAAFAELRQELPKNPLRNATRQAATLLAQFIALAAPKLTGRLAENIKVNVRAAGKVTSGRVVVNTIGGRGSPANAFYWRFLEEGWKTSGGFHQFPFIRGVFDAKSREAAQKVIDACAQQIAKARAKIARAGEHA